MAGKLIYLGGGFLPGEPAADHEEPDEEKFQAKLASGRYRSESGKEIRERAAVVAKAKADVNAKEAANVKARAVDARSEATSADRAAERLGKDAEAAEARVKTTEPRRGGS